jgi:hypothetical protein
MDPDPAPSFIGFKDKKENIFSYFFLITCPQAHHLQSSDRGGPKTCGSGSGSPTLLIKLHIRMFLLQFVVLLTHLPLRIKIEVDVLLFKLFHKILYLPK